MSDWISSGISIKGDSYYGNVSNLAVDTTYVVSVKFEDEVSARE